MCGLGTAVSLSCFDNVFVNLWQPGICVSDGKNFPAWVDRFAKRAIWHENVLGCIFVYFLGQLLVRHGFDASLTPWEPAVRFFIG